MMMGQKPVLGRFPQGFLPTQFGQIGDGPWIRFADDRSLGRFMDWNLETGESVMGGPEQADLQAMRDRGLISQAYLEELLKELPPE